MSNASFTPATLEIAEQLESGKETVAFRVSNQCSDRSEYAHIVLDVVYVQHHKGRHNDSIGFYGNYYNEKHHYKGLKVTCQMDRHTALPYAWRLVIDDYCGLNDVSLEKAEEIVKTLRPIHRKLEKICSTEGSVESFEAFVVRLSRALNVKAFYAKYGSDIQFKRSDNIGALRDHLRSLIAENQKTLGFASVA